MKTTRSHQIFWVGVLAALVLTGCKTGELENRLDKMEERAEVGEARFRAGDYAAAEETFKNLEAERTVSSPLYRLNGIPCLVLSVETDKAHEAMQVLRVELEELYDPESEKKALSKWHGEINKVYKGTPHEMGLFYALMSLSFAQRGAYEDAWRCVQNGLLHDSDAQNDQYRSDDTLLLYLGTVFAEKIGETDSAQQCRTRLKNALAQRHVWAADLEKHPQSAYRPLVGVPTEQPNAVVMVWTGTPPQFGRKGKYGEKRTVLKGEESAAEFMTVSVDGGAEKIIPSRIGDVNFQATTQGGRLMDNVLADKAEFKQDMKNFQKAAIGLSGLCFAASLATLGSSKESLVLSGTLLAAGVGFLVVDGVFYWFYDKTDPRADIRAWKTMPGQLNVMPLTLPAGKHELVVRSYVGGDVFEETRLSLNVTDPDRLAVAHVVQMDDSALDDAVAIFNKTVKAGTAHAPAAPPPDYPEVGECADCSVWYNIYGWNHGEGRFVLNDREKPLALLRAFLRHKYRNRWTASLAQAGECPIRPDVQILGVESFYNVRQDDAGKRVLETRLTVAVRQAAACGKEEKFQTGPVKFFYAWSRVETTAATAAAVSAAEKKKGLDGACDNLFKMPEFRAALHGRSVMVKTMKKDGASK